MLILARRVSERLILNIPPSDKPQTVTIMPTEIRGDAVRLGIQAPREIEIVREEISGRKS